jgi:hypothetical protein
MVDNLSVGANTFAFFDEKFRAIPPRTSLLKTTIYTNQLKTHISEGRW